MRGRRFPLSFIALGIILVICACLAAFYLWPHKKVALNIPDPSLEKTAAISKNDSDNDGLLDWEETLLSTDTSKADTDGDGTPDGAEVQQKRNPLIPGPNDLVEHASSSPLTLATIKQDGTLTDQIARDLVTTLMNYKQTGQLDTSHEDQLVNTLVDTSNRRALAPQYNAADLNLLSVDSTSTRTTYHTAVVAALKPLSENKVNELLIIGEAVEKKDAASKAKADDLVASYKRAVDALAKVSVPPSAALTHLAFLNAFASYVSSLDALRTLEVDPIMAAVVVQNYKKMEGTFKNTATTLSGYFQKYSIN